MIFVLALIGLAGVAVVAHGRSELAQKKASGQVGRSTNTTNPAGSTNSSQTHPLPFSRDEGGLLSDVQQGVGLANQGIGFANSISKAFGGGEIDPLPDLHDAGDFGTFSGLGSTGDDFGFDNSGEDSSAFSGDSTTLDDEFA